MDIHIDIDKYSQLIQNKVENEEKDNMDKEKTNSKMIDSNLKLSKTH